MKKSTEEIKEKLDIVDYIGGFVKLSKAGVNYKGLCPFHKEKTPSFMVSPERGTWHCFGCGEGGDIFQFAMKYENLDFVEALKLLARQAGVELKNEDPRLRSESEKLRQICEKANDFFQSELKQNPEVKNYLLNRGLKSQIVDEWEIGFAMESRDALIRHLGKFNFSPEDAVKAGLALKSSVRPGTFFDRFRKRIIFPISDTQGRICGFTGRIFGEARPEEPKYLNTPETPIFNKGKILYGYFKNKKAIREKKEAILVEGQMDLLSSWQEGLENVVATSGTALTQDQLKLIRRSAETLIVAYDMDEAGRKAAERAIDMAKTEDFFVRVISLPEPFKDISDFISVHSSDAKEKLSEILSQAEESTAYYYRRAFSKKDLSDIMEKKKSVSFFLEKLNWIASPVEKSHWINKIENDLNIKESYLEEEMNRLKIIQDSGHQEIVEISEKKESIRPRLDLIKERILALAIKEKTLAEELEVLTEYFSGLDAEIAKTLKTESIPENLSERTDYLKLLGDYEFGNGEFNFAEEFFRAVKELKKETLRDSVSKQNILIKQAEENGDLEELGRQLDGFRRLLSELSELEQSEFNKK